MPIRSAFIRDRSATYDDAGGQPQAQPFPVAGYAYANFSVVTQSTTGVLRFVGSVNHGGPWADISGASDVTGSGCTGPISVVGIAYVGVKCITSDSGKTAQIDAFLSEGQ